MLTGKKKLAGFFVVYGQDCHKNEKLLLPVKKNGQLQSWIINEENSATSY